MSTSSLQSLDTLKRKQEQLNLRTSSKLDESKHVDTINTMTSVNI